MTSGFQRRLVLPGNMADLPIWQQFADAVDEFTALATAPYINNLGNAEGIRDLDPIYQQNYGQVVEWPDVQELGQYDLVMSNRTLGFSTDSSTFISGEAQSHFLDSWSIISAETLYSNDWWKPIELCLGRSFKVQQLWTDDYINFYVSPGGPLVIEGGTWYLSNHVNLELDDNLTTDELAEAQELFNSYAPANLVLNSVAYTLGNVYEPLPLVLTIGCYIDITI